MPQTAPQVMRPEHLTKLQVALREMEDRTAEIREVLFMIIIH